MKGKPRWLQVLLILAAVLLIALNRADLLGMLMPESAPSQGYERRVDDGELHWGNIGTLQDHFDRHGADFDARDPEDYARQAHAFYLDREQFQVKTDIDGTLRIYDAQTNAFGAYSAEGATKTYFKPVGGQAYFDRQPGE